MTGSYEGATRSCSCLSPLVCQLTKDQRIELEREPGVSRARQRNWGEYEALTEPSCKGIDP